MISDGGTDLERVFHQLDDEVAAALVELLESDPEFVRSMLREYGYLIDEQADHQREEQTLADLNESERRLLEICADLGTPKSIAQIRTIVEQEHPAFLADYQSATDRSWLNRKLNTLVEEGLIGKFRDGRTVRYTTDIETAIRHWALLNDRFVEELSAGNVDKIVADTGIPRQKVVAAINSLVD